MSGLRFFEDHMLSSIAADRRIAEIERNAKAYTNKCQDLRQQMGPAASRGRLTGEYYAATEGLCAARIIMEGAQQ